MSTEPAAPDTAAAPADAGKTAAAAAPTFDEQAAALSAQFAVEQGVIEKGGTLEDALKAGREFSREQAKKAGRAVEPAEADPTLAAISAGADWNDVQKAQTAALNKEAVEHLTDRYGLSPEIAAELEAGKPATPQEYRLAVAARERMMRDEGFAKKVLEGDADANRQMFLANSIISRGQAAQA
jgi:hypothetical protein